MLPLKVLEENREGESLRKKREREKEGGIGRERERGNRKEVKKIARYIRLIEFGIVSVLVHASK